MRTDKQLVKRLEKDEFAEAVKKGLGRALLHVMHHGVDDVADLVLDACIHNQTYDPQCEPRRAAWLFRMFRDSTQYQKLRESILGKLKTETDTWDFLQLCGLAKEMAARGDKYARQELGERVREKASIPSADDWLGADLWIEIEGADGMLELARIYGHRLLLNPDDFVPDDLLSVNDAEQGFKEILFQHAQEEPGIKAYWDYLEARGVLNPRSAPIDQEAAKRLRHERLRQQHGLESILQDARNKLGEYPGRYALFGRHATADELKEIYTHLMSETDAAIRLRLLWVFRRAPLPELNEMIFHWADGTDDALREASIAALAQKEDEQVHCLARSKARAGKLVGADSEALDLFLSNYDSDDAHLISQALVSLNPLMEDAHTLGYSVARLAKQKRDAALADALKWVYENTPCTNCRYTVVEQLGMLQQLDDALLYECQFDSAEDIRAFAQKQREGV